MAENSKIEWTHHTANLWHGCTEVHAGCDNCYARVLSHRWKRDLWGNDKPRMMIMSVWKDLARYQKLAAAAGEIHRVFVGSMMDIFEKPMELVDNKGEMVTDGVHVYPTFTDALRDQLFEEITEGKYPNLLFLLLTKRPSNINKMIPESWKANPPSNVMFGTSPVDQKTADTLIPQLLQVNGKHFLSVEPMLGPVDLKLLSPLPGQTERIYRPVADNIDWVICGGESGHGARPMHPEWAMYLRDQCEEASIPFFFKQWGEHSDRIKAPDFEKAFFLDNDGSQYKGEDIVPRGKNCTMMANVGKKKAGRELNGILYDQFPVIN